MSVDARLMTVVQRLAADGYAHLDADRDVKALKILSALAGVRGCYPELDAIYAAIGSGTPDASATDEKHEGAALLRVDASAVVQTETLPNNGLCGKCGQSIASDEPTVGRTCEHQQYHLRDCLNER